MHILRVPSFLPTNRTGAPYGDVLGSISPLLISSLTCDFTSASSAGLSLYIGLNGVPAPGTSGMVCAVLRRGGRPEGKSSGNTSLYFSTSDCTALSKLDC